MGSKKITALVLCIAVIAGCTGCGKERAKKEAAAAIEETMDQYEEVLQDMDPEGLLDLTDWDADDKQYLQTEALLRPDTSNEGAIGFYKEIASTISVDYSPDEIEVNDGKASFKVRYVMVDWEDALDRYLESRNARKAVKDTRDTVTVKGKISFVAANDGWKISKMTGLDEVYSFIGMFKDYIPDPTETAPTETEPVETKPVTTEPSDTVPSGTDFPDSLEKAAYAFTGILETNMVSIEKAADDYGIDPVGIYDIDGNGLPELYFFTDAGNGYSTVLHIYEYREYKGEADEVISVPDVLNRGQANDHIIFATDKELLITFTYGESYSYHVETMVFDLRNGGGSFKWDMNTTYVRDLSSSYDVSTDTETVTYKYYLNDREISESEYTSGMKDIVSRTKIILGRRFMLDSTDPEYDLILKPVNNQLSYYEAIEYLNTLL